MNAARLGICVLPDEWAAQTPADRRRLLSLMEAAGVAHVLLSDHVTFHGGWGSDGLVSAASVLAGSDRIGAYVSSYLLALRHPVTVARQLVTLAQLAPGRITLGVGVGGEDRREIEACGVDPATRGRRTDEALGLLRRLLAGEEVTVAGEFFTQDRTALRPVPDPPVPIVVAGRSPAALRRTGRLGDGWLGIWVSAERCREAFDTIAGHAADAGRPDVDWQHGMSFWCGFGRDRAEARARVAPAMEALYRTPFETFERYTPCGTPAEIAAFAAPYLEAGCATLSFVPHAGSPEAGIEAVAAVRAELGLPEPSGLAATPTGG